MMLDDVMNLWWEHITGPHMLVEEIVASLSKGCSVVLQMEGSLPWGEQVRDLVRHGLEQVSLDAFYLDGGTAREKIAPALLNQFFRSGLAMCPADYKSQQAYLKDKGVFAGSVVWIVPAERGDLTAPLQFLSDYRGKDLERYGAFVLEIPEGQRVPQLSGSCVLLRYSDYVRHSDLLLYASILADGIRKNPEMKGYMACAAANLADRDVELIPELLREADFEREDPGEALLRMWEEGYVPCPSDRPDQQELQVRVWKAQLQSAFALIEMERLRITDEYSDIIREALTSEYWEPKWDRTGHIQQRGEELESASDVELGTLVRMMALKRSDSRTEPLLSFPDKELREKIIFLTECRNCLAHHRACTPEQMRELLCLLKDR